jgi:hypothetical protein
MADTAPGRCFESDRRARWVWLGKRKALQCVKIIFLNHLSRTLLCGEFEVLRTRWHCRADYCSAVGSCWVNVPTRESWSEDAQLFSPASCYTIKTHKNRGLLTDEILSRFLFTLYESRSC